MKLEVKSIVFLCCNLIILNDFVLGSISIYDEKNSTLINVDDLSAAFGPRLPESGFIGFINTAEPLHGCTQIRTPPNISFVDPKQWIALIKRTPTKYGNCSFDLKVYNAQQAGYSAVIIYNSESDNLLRMSSSGQFKITIPSVFVGKSSGILIDSAYTYKNKTLVIITNDDADLSYLLIPFICVVSICFVIAISIFVVKFAIHFYKLRKNRFPKSALKKIPTKKYQKSDKYDTCPICLNEYEEGVKIRILPCEHAYHIECIDKWLLRNNRFCPVCKRRVLPGGSDSESSDESTDIPSNVTANRRNSSNENQPNEEDDTNESSRLLVNIRNNSNDDNLSSVTLNTANLNQINDLSSLNNQMTTSQTSSQVMAQANSKDLRSSSSRYGSITSVNNINTTNMPQTSKVDQQDFENILFKDSKSTPDDEYFTPGATSFKIDTEIKPQASKQSKTNTKSKKSFKKSNSSNQILSKENKISMLNSKEPSVKIENESSSASCSSITTNQDSDTAVLLTKQAKVKQTRSQSPLTKNLSHDSTTTTTTTTTNAQESNDEEDDNSKIV